MSAGKNNASRNGAASSSVADTADTSKTKDKANKLDDFNIVRTIGNWILRCSI